MFSLANGYAKRGMAAYCELQEAEFSAESQGYTATRHQREVGTGYFDLVNMVITSGKGSTTAMSESTESEQFTGGRPSATAALLENATKKLPQKENNYV
jgi:isocitrate lyase